jgi:beta-glucosidase
LVKIPPFLFINNIIFEVLSNNRLVTTQMQQRKILTISAIVAATIIACAGSAQKWHKENHEQYTLVIQKNGRTLGYSPASGLKIITKNGFAFKDMNGNGKLDVYEDWRQTPEKRAKDLASQLSIDEISGLMLYSIHQAVPSDPEGYWGSHYNGKPLYESGLPHSAISDRQKTFLKDDNLRSILMVRVESPKISAEWNNNLQSYAETLPHCIPVNISSDPRHETGPMAEFNAGSGGTISLWPCSLGMAATFDPALEERFGEVCALEYRAMGITTSLFPQIDLATEPRWFRYYGTFGEDSDLDRDMARAVVDGLQTSEGDSQLSDHWGYHSVNAMVKHWPSGGPEEGGRDAHYAFGKYTVYPGNNFSDQIKPFVDGAFKLNRGTQKASSVMPYYTISFGIDPSGNNVGNSYSKYIISDLLRGKYGFDGVICTDWGITHDYHKIEDSEGKCWGLEKLTEAQRHFTAILAGVDQFGGNNEKAPVIDAYKIWVSRFGEQSARARFEQSASRLLLNMFRIGLFDNPYVDPAVAEKLVGCPEYMKEGYDAQLKSVIMLKNHDNVLPIKGRKTVYLAKKHYTRSQGFFGPARLDDYWAYPVDSTLVSRYYDITSDPKKADFALVFIEEPAGGYGYSVDDRNKGGNGYVPISLQYTDYTATYARDPSIAGGDPLEPSLNRSYKGKTVKTDNKEDLDLVVNTKKLMGNKPVIVSVRALRPFVPEFEGSADAVLVAICLQYQASLDIIKGNAEPSGLLPMQLPLDMRTVEEQKEDVPHDMICYKDADGHVYDFAYGLNWKGVINDARVQKYGHPTDGKIANESVGITPNGVFGEGYIGDIKADGWLSEFLNRQRTGMTGHPESLDYPYNSILWAGEIKRDSESHGNEWWRYEQTAYYTDGLIRLGYLLRDTTMINKAVSGIKYTLEHTTGKNIIGMRGYDSMWPMAVYFRVLKAYYEATGDQTIPAALEKHYLSFTPEQVTNWRNIVNIEGILWTYGITHDRALLDLACKAFDLGGFDLNEKVCMSDEKMFMHGVTCVEEMKLPMLLYAYTGDSRYEKMALNVERKLERDQLLPDGVPSSAEVILDRKPTTSHETCDITDYTWTLGYFLMTTGNGKWADMIEKAVFNAGPGAVTKDFKALQYFSSVNQFIATGNSNNNWFFHGSTWMAYRPTHQTECCAGNVHRFMPNYVSRMWMRGKGGALVAALYGPSEITVQLPDGKNCTVKEETAYPYNGEIEFSFSMDGKSTFPFSFRIPGWCTSAKVTVDGKPYEGSMAPGEFVTLNREFHNGSKIKVSFQMETLLRNEPGQGVYVQRGPLIYSYAIPENKVEDKEVYANMYGKVPGNPDFKCWSITPSGPWNFAMCADSVSFSKEAKTSVHIKKGYPLDPGNAPVTVTVPVKRIEWQLDSSRFTPAIPKDIVYKSDKVEYIKLVPYGSTELRLTVFPKGK